MLTDKNIHDTEIQYGSEIAEVAYLLHGSIHDTTQHHEKVTVSLHYSCTHFEVFSIDYKCLCHPTKKLSWTEDLSKQRPTLPVAIF